MKEKTPFVPAFGLVFKTKHKVLVCLLSAQPGRIGTRAGRDNRRITNNEGMSRPHGNPALKIFPVEKRRKVFVRHRAEVTGRLQSDPYPNKKHSTLSLGHRLPIVPPKHPDDTLKMPTPRSEAPFHLADFTTPADVVRFSSVPQPRTAFLPYDNRSLAEGLAPFHTFLSFVFILCQKRAITGRMEALSKHHAGSHFLPCPSPGESSPAIPAGMRCVGCWSHESRRHGKIL